MKKMILLLLALPLTGCAIGIVNSSSTLNEKPFATVEMAGDITQASRCVGRYWENATKTDLNDLWEVRTYSYQVEVSGVHLGQGRPPVGLVIDFQEQDGKTIAYAHISRLFKSDKDRIETTRKALAACKAK